MPRAFRRGEHVDFVGIESVPGMYIANHLGLAALEEASFRWQKDITDYEKYVQTRVRCNCWVVQLRISLSLNKEHFDLYRYHAEFLCITLLFCCAHYERKNPSFQPIPHPGIKHGIMVEVLFTPPLMYCSSWLIFFACAGVFQWRRSLARARTAQERAPCGLRRVQCL